jgi:hypothetical protein
MEDTNVANAIEIQNNAESIVKHNSLYDLVSEDIQNELIAQFGSLESIYPSIVKYLFAGSNANKIAHKRMFWRVFGDIAYNALQHNMQTYTVCDTCGMKLPSWSKSHICPKNTVGFFECCDCGAWCERVNSKQCRCASCQEEFTHMKNNLFNKMKYRQKISTQAA